MAQFALNLLKNLKGGKLPTMAIRLRFLIENFAAKLSCQVSGLVFPRKSKDIPSHWAWGACATHQKEVFVIKN